MATDRDAPVIVIPVRGGSVGIPRKALRPLGGMAPLVRSITLGHEVGADVLVVADTDELRALAATHGATVVMEHTNPDGMQTLDGAVWQGVAGQSDDDLVVATIQCTSPFLRAETVQRCLELVRQGHGTAMTVRDDRHVAWQGPLDAPELATPWAVRQLLPHRWVMTGGCIATRRGLMSPTRRFGGSIHLVEVSGQEALDLDTPQDWALAEWYCGATERETLTARILSEQRQWVGVIAMLSAWGESPEELIYRNQSATLVPGRIIRLRGRHTREEAELAVSALHVGEHDITIVTSAYHQVRAFLTFLQVLREHGLHRTVRLWNAPAASQIDKLASEWEKIRTYHERGHVASYDEGLEYLAWRDALVPA